jgi:hypothetical protein
METIALQVDVHKSDQELSRDITARCSGFGSVKSVQLHRSPKLFALVEMANRNQALELATQYGGSTFGSCVLVHLEPVGQVA